MSGAKKRQTMAKQARERAVREKRELKRERKRLRLAGETETPEFAEDSAETGLLAEDSAETGLHLVAEDGSATEAVEVADVPTPAAAEEDELRGAHA